MTGQPFPQDITAGGQLIVPSIHSPNFVSGASGWSINNDGSVEFNSGVFRATITAASISSALIQGSVFENSEVIINSQGFFLYSSAPALGNLIISIARGAGTDSFGNTFGEGIWMYAGQNVPSAQMRPDLQAFLIYG